MNPDATGTASFEPVDDAPTAEIEPTGYEPPARPRTGHPKVDAALETLEQAAALPPIEQIGAYDAALGTLQEALSTIDENP